MIAQVIADTFATVGHTWKIGGRYIVPSEEDVTRVLDEAFMNLYNRETGTSIEVGGLTMTKTPTGYQVEAYVGDYK